MTLYHTVFISYSHSQAAIVEQLKRDLRGQDLHIWLDHESLTPGTRSWEAAIRAGIQASDVVLYIASPEALASNNVQGELDVAEREGKPVIPIWVAGDYWVDVVPMVMSKMQYIDARESRYPQAVQQLLNTLGIKAMSASTQSTPAPISEQSNWEAISITVHPIVPKVNRKTIIFTVISVGVAISLLALVISKINTVLIRNGSTLDTGRQPVPSSIMNNITSINSDTFSQVGRGEQADPFKETPSNTSVNKNSVGLPIFFYGGAEYCPYCASERWSMIVALTRFGTFRNLHLMTSSSTDVYANTNTFTFYRSSYSSNFLDFQPVEM